MSENTISGVLIHLSAEDSAHLIEWVQEIDWRIIKRQMERGGNPIVLYKSPGEPFSRFDRLEEIPAEHGLYRPHYGHTGGGFEYTFRAVPGGIKVSGSSQGARFYKSKPRRLSLCSLKKLKRKSPKNFKKGLASSTRTITTSTKVRINSAFLGILFHFPQLAMVQ